jgi:hypothetical protein
MDGLNGQLGGARWSIITGQRSAVVSTVHVTATGVAAKNTRSSVMVRYRALTGTDRIPTAPRGREHDAQSIRGLRP